MCQNVPLEIVKVAYLGCIFCTVDTYILLTESPNTGVFGRFCCLYFLSGKGDEQMKFSKRCLAMLLTLLMVLSVASTSALATENAVTGTEVSPSQTTSSKKGEFQKYKYSDYEADHKDAPYPIPLPPA